MNIQTAFRTHSLLSGGAVPGGRNHGAPGLQGPQPGPVHPAGVAGRPARAQRAESQSLLAAGGAGLLQKVSGR